MPIRYTIDPHYRAVIIEITGKLSLGDAAEAAGKLRREPFFQPTFSVVFDLSEAERIDMDADAISSFLNSGHDPFQPGVRRAIIATRPDTYGIGRMYQGVSGDLNIYIFRSRDEAMPWIAQSPVRRGCT